MANRWRAVLLAPLLVGCLAITDVDRSLIGGDEEADRIGAPGNAGTVGAGAPGDAGDRGAGAAGGAGAGGKGQVSGTGGEVLITGGTSATGGVGGEPIAGAAGRAGVAGSVGTSGGAAGAAGADAADPETRQVRSLGGASEILALPNGEGFAARYGTLLTYYDQLGKGVGVPVVLAGQFDSIAVSPSGAIVGANTDNCWEASIMDDTGAEIALAVAEDPQDCGSMGVIVAAMDTAFIVQCRADNCNPDGGCDSLHSWFFDYDGALLEQRRELVCGSFTLRGASDHAIGVHNNGVYSELIRYGSTGEIEVRSDRLDNDTIGWFYFPTWRTGGYAVAGGKDFCTLDTDGSLVRCQHYEWMDADNRCITGLAGDGADRLALLLSECNCYDNCRVSLLEIDSAGVMVGPELTLATAPPSGLIWSGARWVALVGGRVLLVEP